MTPLPRLANPARGRYLGALKLNPNKSSGRRSSVVEHPLRKRVVGGSNPSAGTTLLATENWSGAYRSPLLYNRETRQTV